MEPQCEWAFSTQVLKKKEGADGAKRELTVTRLTRPVP